jgi:hypothetical protein
MLKHSSFYFIQFWFAQGKYKQQYLNRRWAVVM